MKNLAVIPARSGSKGLKDKNIKLLNGKPLMAYSIEEALKSRCFDCVHVSTDSSTYAGIAKEYGADVPFLRSQANASDYSNSWDAVEEVLNHYATQGMIFDTVMLLQPTSPLRTYKDIQNAYQLMQEKNANAIIGMCEMEHSPLWANTIPNDLSLNGFTHAPSLRQEIKTYYRINGAIYLVKVPFLKENHNLYREGSYAYIMEPARSVDIDTELDFEMVEFLMNRENLHE